MQWRSETFEQKIARQRRWHKWFAWHPVRLESDGRSTKVWLEVVGRKWAQDPQEYHNSSRWFYCHKKEIEFNILKDKDNEPA